MAAAILAPASPAQYPLAPTDLAAVTALAIGRTIPDIYRPLEADTAAATLEWVEAERALTGQWLSQVPFRDSIHKRLTELNSFTKHSLPWRSKLKTAPRYFYYRNDGLQGQAVLYAADSPTGENERVVLDPNKLSEDGTVALTGLSESPDGKLLAYMVSRSGSDWTEIYVLDLESGELLPEATDHIEWAKFTGAEWWDDGFFYSAYPQPEKGSEYSGANTMHNVYYHRLRTPQTEDILVWTDPDAPLHFHSVEVAGEGDTKALVLSVGGQGHGNALLVHPLPAQASPENVRDLAASGRGSWTVIENSQEYDVAVLDVMPDGKLRVYTNVDAPRGRVVEIDPTNPDRRNWIEIVSETADGLSVLQGVYLAGREDNSENGPLYILDYMRDAASEAIIFDPMAPQEIRKVDFPTLGTAAFSSNRRSPEIFYSFSSFVYPAEIYSYNASTGRSELIIETEVPGLNPQDYITEQIFFDSKDGKARIPMFITRRRDVQPGNNDIPVYLYGYGGFNISLPPGFSANRLFWLENGGAYVQVNLRGGGEYGQAWHEAGTKMEKQNVFDDFIGAAEWLNKNGYTRPELTAIEGGSNGGLLVGAVTNQRPELFGVAIPRVGVMDMLRYHLFTIGWNWAHDYGTADDSPEMADYLRAYSPLHSIREGVDYPAVLVTTADHDDRVVPAHSFKYAAALQAARTGSKPKLIRIDSKAGHGAGKPVGKVVDEFTDIYTFIMANMGIEPKAE